MFVECTDGDVRLVNGNNSLEGRVEVCFNNVWGTVCDNRFDSDDAQVICNQISLPFDGGCILIRIIMRMYAKLEVLTMIAK